MKKSVTLLLAGLCAGSLVLNLALYGPATTYPHLVAVSWGDSKYGPALYGAYVFYEERGDQLAVRATIYIDRPTLWQRYEHDTLELGSVRNDAEAVAQWGRIAWSEQGVAFGHGDKTVQVKRADLEKHR